MEVVTWSTQVEKAVTSCEGGRGSIKIPVSLRHRLSILPGVLAGAWNSFLITRHEGGCKLPISDVSVTVAGEPHKGQEEGKARPEVETFVLCLAQPLPPADLEPRHLN